MKVFKRFIKGILLKGESSDPSDNLEGSMWHNSTDNEIKSYLNSGIRTVVTEDQVQDLTNKTIGDTNTINAQTDAFTIDDATDGTKQVDFNNAGSTTGTKTTIQVSQTANRGIALPDASTTLVGDDTTDTLTNKTFDADGTGNVLSNVDDGNIKAGAAINATKIHDGSVDNTEFGYLNGVTSGIQGQLDSKADIAGATDNRLVRTDGTDNIQQSGITVDDTDNVTGVNNLTVDGDLTVNGTTTTLNTATLDVEDTNITVNKGGTDISSEGAGLTVERVGTDGSLIYEDALASKFKLGALGSEAEVMDVSSSQTVTNKDMSSSTNNVDTASSDSFTRNTGNQQVVSIPDTASPDNFVLEAYAQSLSNKDIDGGTASNSNRITIPKNTKTNLDGLTRKEGTLVYATDVSKLFIDDGGNLTEIGSGGEGGINYIVNPNAEIDTSQWQTYNDGAVAAPIDGTGGTATVISLSRTTTSTEILRGEASFKISKSAANGQGEGVSTLTWSIDPHDQGKVLSVSFDYKNLDTNYASGDLRVYIYDAGNAVIIPVENEDDGDILSYTGSGGSFHGTFQSASNSDSYALIIHNTSTNALAWDMSFDRVKVTSDTTVPGSIITDWKSFTPTGSWTTNTTYTGFKRRVGDEEEYDIQVATSGAPDAVALEIDIPDGKLIDTAKLANTTAAEGSINGVAIIHDNSASARYHGTITYSTNSKVLIRNLATTASDAFHQSVTNLNPMSFGANDTVSIKFTVPIEGWSSGASLSTTEANFMTVQAIYNVSASTANSSFADAATEIVDYDNVVVDTHNTVSTGASWSFTAPRTGNYLVCASTHLTDVTNLEDTQLDLYKNGSIYARLHNNSDAGGNGDIYSGGSQLIDMVKGDTLDIRFRQNNSVSGAKSLNTAAERNRISIMEMPDFRTFSVHGQTEYLDVIATTQTSTDTADTYKDASGMSLTLSPGTWDIGYNCCGYFQESGVVNRIYGNMAITDSNNNIIQGTVSLVSVADLDGGQRHMLDLSRQTRITVTDTETYKLRLRCDKGSADATFSILATSLTGALTDPDVESVLWAKRIG